MEQSVIGVAAVESSKAVHVIACGVLAGDSYLPAFILARA
jgi:hypothetical protein